MNPRTCVLKCKRAVHIRTPTVLGVRVVHSPLRKASVACRAQQGPGNIVGPLLERLADFGRALKQFVERGHAPSKEEPAGSQATTLAAPESAPASSSSASSSSSSTSAAASAASAAPAPAPSATAPPTAAATPATVSNGSSARSGGVGAPPLGLHLSGGGNGGSGGNGGGSGGGGGGGSGRGDRRQQLQLEVRVISSISQVSREEWDAVVADCADGELNPFLLWSFLHALEESGSASRQTGWLPQHVLVREAAAGGEGPPAAAPAAAADGGGGGSGRGGGSVGGGGGGRLLGCVPLYLKGHSYGEYVFDSAWAQYAAMLGVRYYPKLQAAVPFTPVTGPRLLMSNRLVPEERASVVRALGRALVDMADSLGVSGLHLTFTRPEEWAALGELGFKQRLGIQFHWENPGYESFEDFLADLKQSKRKSIRQERKSISRAGLAVHRLPGAALGPAHWDRFHDFYTATVDRKWGNAYLTREFFHRLGEALPERVLLVAATESPTASAAASAAAAAAAAAAPPPAGAMVAGALNLVGSHALFGRNWGQAEGREATRHLHFELCYYQALEEAIARRLPRVEAGAQGEHKLQRGYLPSLTYSCHYLRDPRLGAVVDKFLQRERAETE